uniref:Uncharacterized protein n=1 Tax=Oryza sativa subsp. japonica TaxID=39947 RepID=Q9AYC3_ORYSJ|nr:Hypothetical protein [Oryza sativa Japonica Group]
MEVDEVGGRWTFSRANEGYTSCGPVVEMSWHRAGVLLLGAQSCLPVPGVPAVGGIGSDGLETMSRLPSVYRGGMWHVVTREEDVSCGTCGCVLLSTVVVLSLAQFFPNPEEEFLEDEGFGV